MIIVSASNRVEQQAHDPGADAFLAKPSKSKHLLALAGGAGAAYADRGSLYEGRQRNAAGNQPGIKRLSFFCSGIRFVFTPDANGKIFYTASQPGGTIAGVMNVIPDVAHRIKAEMRLRALHAQLKENFSNPQQTSAELANIP